MTKKEIVRTISEEIGLTQLQTKEIVQKTFNAIVEALVEEGRIELRNFGVFEVKRRAPRKARNPRTGEKVFVPEKYVVTFKPGKEMEERVRELERQAAARAKLAAEGGGPLQKNSVPQRVTTTRPMTVLRPQDGLPVRLTWMAETGHQRTLRCFPAAAFFSSRKSQLRP